MSKYLDKSGVQELWDKTKGLVQNTQGDLNSQIEGLEGKIGQADGIASLDSTGKLPATQLPNLKTVNGESIVGTGDIEVDLNIYTIVESLPEDNINPNKIYLVLGETSEEQNLYTEYAYINNEWEKLGEYKAEVDLTPYLKKEDIATEVAKANFVTFNDKVREGKDGLMPNTMFTTLEIYGLSHGGHWSTSTTPDKKGPVLVLESVQLGERTPSSNTIGDIPIATSTTSGCITSTTAAKIEGIEDNATADEAITLEELREILV